MAVVHETSTGSFFPSFHTTPTPPQGTPSPLPAVRSGEGQAISPLDRGILRSLAESVAMVAASPRMRRTRELWRSHNDLERVRPPVFCDPERSWSEIIPPASLRCSHPLTRHWEMRLRQLVFWAEKMGDDRPIEPYFDLPYLLADEDWGLKPQLTKERSDGSRSWEPPLKDYAADLKKLHPPRMEVDWPGSKTQLQLARETFGDLLSVRLVGKWWGSLSLIAVAARLRGLESLHCDFVSHPDEVKEFLRILSDGTLTKLSALEANNLLTLNNEGTCVGSGGFGLTDQLPQPDFAGKVRCQDLWGFADSQEAAHVSSAVYAELVFPFEKPILDRFGLNCYGSCEPLDDRWSIVRQHHNLRRVSVSHGADLAKMAANLEDKYILSLKPNPTVLATEHIDEEAIRQSLRHSLEVTKDCVVEIIMKDTHTLGNRPENVVRWCRIAKEEACRIAGAPVEA